MSADLGRAVVRVAVQLVADRLLPEWSLASADFEALAGLVLASVGQVVQQEHFEPVRVLRLRSG